MLKKTFSLDEKGAKRVYSGIFMYALNNICTILPTVLLLLLVSEMIENLFTEKPFTASLFTYWGGALLLLIVIYSMYVFSYKKNYVVAYEESAETRLNLGEKIRKLPLSYFGNNNLSDLTSTLMDDTPEVENSLASTIPELYGSIVSSIVIILTLLIYNWKMALSLFACLPIAVLIIVIGKAISRPVSVKNRNAKLVLSDALQQYLDNIKIIKSSERREEYKRRTKGEVKNVIHTSIVDELVAGVYLSFAYNVVRVGFGVVVAVGAYLITSGQLTLLTYLLFIFVAAQVYDPLTIVFFKSGELLVAMISAERIRKMNNFPIQKGVSDTIVDNYDIEFENVSFGYNKENVINNISFVAKQGETTALVGPSGCGKSTISKLAARFWDVGSGSIRIGGKNINNIAPDTLLQYFSIVFQDVILFNDTVYNNIKIGKNNATKEEIFNAAKIANCMEFINKLPNGMDTIIGENGKTLSGGERQRISIARALLKDAPIVLLDEATASLDPENETLIQSAIGNLIQNKTVLIIAHRLRSIENCNKIIVLNEGKIMEYGNHAQLLQADGLYKHLFELQRKSADWNIGNL